MGNPNRYESSDVPDYQNYPSPTATDFGRPSFNSESQSSSDPASKFSEQSFSESSSDRNLGDNRAATQERWNEFARSIGASLGRIVVATREQTASAQESVSDTAHAARERVYETFDGKVRPMAEDAQNRVRDIFESRVKPNVDRAMAQAREKFDQAQAQMSQQLDATQKRVRETMDRTHAQVKQTVDQHPLETILAAGVAGILVGVGLRYWRDNRAY